MCLLLLNKHKDLKSLAIMWRAEQADEGSGGDSLASQASHICEL